MLNTRYLKEIIVEQLFIISITKNNCMLHHFYDLKQKSKHTFYFIFKVLRSHLNIYN
jgi:hypothetical protein